MVNNQSEVCRPYVSVIMPVYNSEEFLERSLNSVLNQRFKDFELIIVDDGSKDSSALLCRRYEEKDGRVKVILKDNGGASSARNMGLLSATGRYVCFMDSDDLVKDTYLSNLVSIIDDCDIAMSHSIFVKRGKEHSEPHRYEKGDIDVLFDSENIESSYSPYNKLFKLDIIRDNNIRFDEKIHIGEDRVFVYTYLLHSTGAVISSESDYYYMIREGSLMSKYYDLETELYAYNVYCAIVKELGDKIRSKQAKENLENTIKYFCYRFLKALYRSGKSDRAQRLSVLSSLDMEVYLRRTDDVSGIHRLYKRLLKNKMYKTYDFLKSVDKYLF